MKRSVYIFFLILSLTSCQKCKDKVQPQEKLPDATQTGQNTFGCMVNGQVWEDGAPFPLIALKGHYYNGGIELGACRKKDGVYQNIYIYKTHVFKPDTFVLNNATTDQVNFTDFTNNCDYFTDSINTGQLIITRLDTINGIYSGLFSFKLKKNGCPDIVVTDGRFDVRE